MMDEGEKSDRPTVPTKSSNKAGPAAEEMEERGLAKRNLHQPNTLRMQGRASVSNRLELVRQAAQRDKRMKFTALLHHVYALEMLREAYFDLKRDAAAGVDEETWQDYGQDLEGNLQDLSARLKRGAYRALPVRRVYIPKADGTTEADRGARRGRQDRPTGDRGGLERHLRNGVPRFLVWVPPRAQPAQRAGCPERRAHEEAGELGARRRHSWFFRGH